MMTIDIISGLIQCLEKQSHGSRRLRVLFVVTTVVPAVSSSAWLGWRMVEQDRLLENNRVRSGAIRPPISPQRQCSAYLPKRKTG